MKILKRGAMKDGTEIQIEDWSNVYPSEPVASTISAYPVAKRSSKQEFGPKEGQIFRLEMKFSSKEETEEAFGLLVSGKKRLDDCYFNFYYKEYIKFL